MKKVLCFIFIISVLSVCYLKADQTTYNIETDTKRTIFNALIANDSELYSDKADKADVVEKNNTTVYTPSGDYNPSTKKYVDDGLSGKQNVNSNLTDLSDGTLTGSLIGTGINATNVTNGTLPDTVIPSGITRDSELTTVLGDYTTSSALTTLLSNKQNADADLTTFAGISPTVNVVSLLSALNYSAMRTLLDLEAGTDFYSVTAMDILLGSYMLRSTYDANLDGYIDDSVLNSTILRDAEIDTLAELNNILGDADLISVGNISGSTSIGLTTGYNYTNFGVLTDDTLNEMFGAIDTGLNSVPKLDGTHTVTGTYSFPDTAYNVSSWDGILTPVTKNSLRDYMYNFDADGDGSFTDETWFPSTHSALTLGTNTNGLSILGQVLSLDLADTDSNGSLAFGDYNFLRSIDTEAELKSLYNLEIGTDVQGYDADLADLADGSLSGSVIGTGISGSNITTGTVADARIDAAITRDSELSGGLGTKQDSNANLSGVSGLTPTANSLIGWNSDGNAIENKSTVTLNTLNVGEINSTATDGERGIILPENTTKSPGSGLEEIYNEGGLLKYSENGVEKNFITIDDTAGDTDTDVTLSADKIVELIASGGSGVPDGTDTNDILSWDGDSWEPIALEDHPAFSSLLTAFNNAGLNSFTFTPSVTYPVWAGTSPVAISFDVTDTSTTYAVADVDYQRNGTGGFVVDMTNTTGDTWTADVTISTDGAHTVQLEAVDDKSGTPNSGQSAVYTINFDGTDPVIVATADSTHDGTTVVNGTCALTETNPASPAVTFTATGCTPTSGSCTGTYPNFTTPDLTPDGTDDIVVTFTAEDLAGNEATGTDLVQEFAYTGGGGTGSLTTYIAGTESNGASLSTGTGTIAIDTMTYATNHLDVANAAFNTTVGYAQIQTSGNIDYAVGKISFWVYPTATQTGEQYRYLFSDASDYHVFCLVHEADNRLRFRTTSGSAYFTAETSTTLLTQNAWHFVEFTWSDVDDQVTLRIDGGTLNTQSLSFTGATESTNFRLFNASSGGTSGYQGRFDSVSIFSTTTEE